MNYPFKVFCAMSWLLSMAAAGQTIPSGPSHGQISWKSYDVHSGMSYFYGMVVADFDQDGIDEVAFADSFSSLRNMRRNRDAILYLHSNQTGSVEIYREDFSYHPIPNPNPHQLIERMVAIDVNQDGWLDIVTVANSHDAILAYLNPGLTALGWTRQVLTMDVPGAVNLALGDLDGDGDKDIVVTMRMQVSVYPAAKPGVGWLQNNGNGTWTYADIDVNFGPTELRTVQTFDIFDEGMDCIVVSDMNTGEVFVYRKRVDKSVFTSDWIKYSPHGIETTAAYNLVADVTGDGRPEFIFGRGDGLYYADLMYNIINPPVVKVTGFHSLTNAAVTEIVSGDLNHDGLIDLVYTIRGIGIYYTLRESAGWKTHWVTSVPQNYHGLRLMDYDRDGLLDVLANIEYERNTLEVWHNRR